jgi:hypothetical protein
MQQNRAALRHHTFRCDCFAIALHLRSLRVHMRCDRTSLALCVRYGLEERRTAFELHSNCVRTAFAPPLSTIPLQGSFRIVFAQNSRYIRASNCANSRCVSVTISRRSRCVHAASKERSNCICAEFAAQSRCVRAAFALHSRCIRAVFALYSRCIRRPAFALHSNAFALYSNIRGAFALHLHSR